MAKFPHTSITSEHAGVKNWAEEQLETSACHDWAIPGTNHASWSYPESIRGRIHARPAPHHRPCLRHASFNRSSSGSRPTEAQSEAQRAAQTCARLESTSIQAPVRPTWNPPSCESAWAALAESRHHPAETSRRPSSQKKASKPKSLTCTAAPQQRQQRKLLFLGG